VRPNPARKRQRILACVDPVPGDAGREAVNAKIMQLANSLAVWEKAELHVIHAWNAFGEGPLSGHTGLRRTGGKKIYELRPDVDWDKGHAVLWLIEALGLQACLPVYIGDDLTDEDAFRALEGKGVGICVQAAPHPTVSNYSLPDPAAVRELLAALAGAPRT